MWGVPVDHEIFSGIGISQWMWYFYQYLEDQNENFIVGRDLVEYNASFVEPEAVRKIRESRENSVNVPDKDFVSGIEYFFGRKINLPNNRRSAEESESIDVEAAMRKAENYKKRTRESQHKKNIDYSHWINMDLE